jgi:hypothetical protein
LTNIFITDFSLINGTLKCNLFADGTSACFKNIQVTSVLGIGDLNGVLLYDFGSNQLTNASYTQMESWANDLIPFSIPCTFIFTSNIDSVSGTNLETILRSKNCIVIA